MSVLPSEAPPPMVQSVPPPAVGKPRRASPKRRRVWPWLVLGALVVTGGGVAVTKSRAKPSTIDPALVVKITKKPLEVDVLETGKVSPKEKADIKSKVAGQVIEVRVQEGARVKKGDTLLVLDPTDYARDAARAEADVAQASNALDMAKVTHARTERGVAQSIMTQIELDTARHDVLGKTAALRSSQVARAAAQDRLTYTKILSPLDGIVIVRGIEPGEVVTPGVQATFDGKALLTVADLSVLTVKVNLNQIDVAKVAIGRKATLTLDALPGHTYHASITKVAPASVKLAGKDQDVFPVEASLEDADGAVKPGMTADVRIHLDAKDGALSVPLEAVEKENGKSFVTRVVTDAKAGERTERVEVSLGLRNDREVEVTGGLSEGDRVLLKPPSAAANETKL